MTEEPDGTCGFRAVARAIYNNAELHQQVRNEFVQYMDIHRNDTNFPTYALR